MTMASIKSFPRMKRHRLKLRSWFTVAVKRRKRSSWHLNNKGSATSSLKHNFIWCYCVRISGEYRSSGDKSDSRGVSDFRRINHRCDNSSVTGSIREKLAWTGDVWRPPFYYGLWWFIKWVDSVSHTRSKKYPYQIWKHR